MFVHIAHCPWNGQNINYNVFHTAHKLALSYDKYLQMTVTCKQAKNRPTLLKCAPHSYHFLIISIISVYRPLKIDCLKMSAIECGMRAIYASIAIRNECELK